MTPEQQDFERRLMLVSFSLASMALRLLANAGLLDEYTREVIRNHLRDLQENIAAIGDPNLATAMQVYLDTLVGVLPPTTR